MWSVRRESVSMERLDGETMLINFESGEYFSFREEAADVMWLIDAGVDRSLWASVLESAYPGLVVDGEVEAGIDAFVADLVSRGIVSVVEGSGGPKVDLPDDYHRNAWRSPRVVAHDDLADLLVIDPIHDVSDDGWPELRRE